MAVIIGAEFTKFLGRRNCEITFWGRDNLHNHFNKRAVTNLDPQRGKTELILEIANDLLSRFQLILY